jgi:hypothetical protein
LTSSVLYAIPVGGKFRAFAGRSQTGGYFDLVGTGRAERIPDLAHDRLSDGHPADDSFTSAAWDDAPTSIDQSANTEGAFRFELLQNHPNPFNPTTTIEYSIAQATHVTLSVHDLLAREVAVLVNAFQDKGRYKIEFSARELASGVYLYTLRAGTQVEVRKLLLLK